MTNPPETTAPKSRRKNSCPDGWLNAGAKVPIRLTVRQEEYCRQAVDIHRFCYNLAVRTHRFCRSNRLPWPSWMDISKAFNAGKREDHPFVTQVAAVVATGAFRDFGQAVDNWRNPALKARVPKNQAPGIHRRRLIPGGRQHEGSPLRRQAESETPLPGQRQAGLHPPQRHLLRGHHPEGERPVVPGPEALETAYDQTGAARQARGHRHRHQPPGHRLRRADLPESQSFLRSGRKNSGDGSGPRPGGRRAPGAGGKPSGRSTGATGASGA